MHAQLLQQYYFLIQIFYTFPTIKTAFKNSLSNRVLNKAHLIEKHTKVTSSHKSKIQD